MSYTITKRPMELADFLKVKKVKPYSDDRQNSKTVNFATIFACSGSALGSQMRQSGFSEEDCDKAAAAFGLTDAINQAILAKKPNQDPLDIKYSLIGTKIRELFAETYPGLFGRTEREQIFAMTHGYVRTWTGPVRHLQEFRFMKRNAKGEVVGADKKLFSAMFKHLKNDATNSPVQTEEVYQAMPNVTAICNMFKKLGLRSRVFNYVHDSQELYVYKPERDLVYAYLNYLASVARQPNFGIPMHIDVEEADPSKGEVFRQGREINIEKFDIKAELAKWNEKFGKNFTFDDIDAVKNEWIPLHGVIDLTPKVGIQYVPRRTTDPRGYEYIIDDKEVLQ